MVDKGLVDQNVFAGRNCRQGDGLLGGRGSRDIDCIDVGAGQQAIVTLNRRDTRACGHESLCGVNPPTRYGDQFGVRRFRDRIGDDARDHACSDDAESKLRRVHNMSPSIKAMISHAPRNASRHLFMVFN